MKRRILSIALILLMLFALVACGSSETSTGSGSLSATDTSGIPGSDTDIVSSTIFCGPTEKPYDEARGNTYTIIQHSPIEDPFGYSQDSLMAEKVADRMAEVQDEWGCTLAFKQVAYGPDFASQIQGLMYAEKGGDLIFSNNNAYLRQTLGTGGNESAMVDLLALDSIINFWDMEKWGNITSRETMMAGGIFYGVTPALWYNCAPLPYYTLVYNKDLIANFDLEDPQEIWEREEWDRDAMLDLFTSCYDDTSAAPIWGVSATMMHMVRASYLASGSPTVVIDRINADGTVDWTHGMATAEATEALQWLKNSINANRKYFNNGKSDWGGWSSHNPFISGQSLFCLTAHPVIFNDIALQCENFGLMPWAGADANMLTGYYENCYSVAIPIFAQDYQISAYLMSDLFEGLDGVESSQDVIDYYRETYFETDLDVTFLLMEGANLQYSYWPNGCDAALKQVSDGLLSASSVKNLVEQYLPTVDIAVETYILPNTVQLEKYRQAGYID